jgi:DNA polymerase I-like protein with 3'-5' exonuclease and polymerase domains
LVQDYRKWGKIKSTYIDGYLKYRNPVTGKIHPDFFALSTDTGRMNCRNPNAQNMPRKTKDPVGVRNFIKAPDGHLILSLDFSQIELRVGAFYCRDEVMMETYKSGGDIHAATTSVIFNVPYEVAQDKHSADYKEHRTIAKNVNFGTFYGLFPRGLQRTLKFKAGVEKSEKECAKIIDNLKMGYKGLTTWQEETKAVADPYDLVIINLKAHYVAQMIDSHMLIWASHHLDKKNKVIINYGSPFFAPDYFPEDPTYIEVNAGPNRHTIKMVVDGLLGEMEFTGTSVI